MRILELVTSRPGLSVSEINREIDLARPTLDYHFRVMDKSGLVRIVSVTGQLASTSPVLAAGFGSALRRPRRLPPQLGRHATRRAPAPPYQPSR